METTDPITLPLGEPPAAPAAPVAADVPVPVTPAAEPSAEPAAPVAQTTEPAAEPAVQPAAEPSNGDTGGLFDNLFSEAATPVAVPSDAPPVQTVAPEARKAVVERFSQELGATYESEDQVIAEVKRLREQAGRIEALKGGDALAHAIVDTLRTGNLQDVQTLIASASMDFTEFDPSLSDEANPMGRFVQPLEEVLNAKAYYEAKSLYGDKITPAQLRTFQDGYIQKKMAEFNAMEPTLDRPIEEKRLRDEVQAKHAANLNEYISQSKARAEEIYKGHAERQGAISEVAEALKTPPTHIQNQALAPEVAQKLAASITEQITKDPGGYLLKLISARQPDGTLKPSVEKLYELELLCNPAHDKAVGRGLMNSFIERKVASEVKARTEAVLAQKLNIDPAPTPQAPTGGAPAAQGGPLFPILQPKR